MAIDTCVENFSGAVLQALGHLLLKVANVTNRGLLFRSAFRMKYA
jgi:hypothetical protein